MIGRKITLVVIFLSIVLATGCATGNVVQEKESIKIGGAFILSGLGSDWGSAEYKAAQLAVDEHNKAQPYTPVELVVEDIQYDNKKAIMGVRKLAEYDHVSVIIGPTWLGGLGGVVALAEEEGIILVTPSDSVTTIQSDKFHHNSFSTWYRADTEASALAHELAIANKTRIALIYGTDPFWTDFKQLFINASRRENLTLIDDYMASGIETDFRTIILRMQKEKPDAILFGLDNEVAMYNFFKQRRELYPVAPIYTTEMIEGFVKKDEYQGLLNGVSFIRPVEASAAFTDKYFAKYGERPMFSTSNAYDATNMVLQAIDAGNTDTDSIRTYLQTREFNTVTYGKTHFDSINGIEGGKFEMKTIGGEE